MTKLENALVWLFVKTWGKFGDHVIAQKDLWNFSADDLETVIMNLAYPRKRENTELCKALTDLIMEKFEEGGLAAFREWSGELHGQVIDTLLQTIQVDAVDKQVMNQPQTAVRILKWDPGMCNFSTDIFENNIILSIFNLSLKHLPISHL